MLSEYYSLLTPNWVYEYNSQYEEGVIYQQNPKSGRTVKEGQTITLKVSLGTLWVQIPDSVIGMTQDEAEQALKDLGVSNVVNSFVIDDSVTSGTVVRTSPEAGQQVEGDATVTLYIAQPEDRDYQAGSHRGRPRLRESPLHPGQHAAGPVHHRAAQ